MIYGVLAKNAFQHSGTSWYKEACKLNALLSPSYLYREYEQFCDNFTTINPLL